MSGGGVIVPAAFQYFERFFVSDYRRRVVVRSDECYPELGSPVLIIFLALAERKILNAVERGYLVVKLDRIFEIGLDNERRRSVSGELPVHYFERALGVRACGKVRRDIVFDNDLGYAERAVYQKRGKQHKKQHALFYDEFRDLSHALILVPFVPKRKRTDYVNPFFRANNYTVGTPY